MLRKIPDDPGVFCEINLGIKKFSGIEIKVSRILLAEFNTHEAKNENK